MEESESLYKILNVAWILGIRIDIDQADSAWKTVSLRRGATWLRLDSMNNQEIKKIIVNNFDLFSFDCLNKI